MKEKKLIARLLVLLMVFAMMLTPVFSFAVEEGADEIPEEVSEEITAEDDDPGYPADTEDGSDLQTEEETESAEASQSEGSDNEDTSGETQTEKPVSGKTILRSNAASPQTSPEWTSEDFTYEEKSKLMYGCDYSRQFYVEGPVVSGFSESGEEKLQNGNTELVIPAKTPDGRDVVGVGDRAFKSKGLTSVQFPTGMMVPYDDSITNSITRRGNFIIHENAFSGNNLTEVYLPAGVLACMSNSFQNNNITKVTFSRTIWWIETLAFANNDISTVNFPQTCDFRLEMHGMPFADNNIRSIRLPDFTEVVNKDSFAMNPGMEPMTEEIAKKRSETDWEKFMPGGEAESGIVYMYTEREALKSAQRIHHIERPTKNQWSPFQKLVVVDGDDNAEAYAGNWSTADFTYEGTKVTGFSESGLEKRATHTKLMIPDRNPSGKRVTEIAASDNYDGGLFGTRDEGFDVVDLPDGLKIIGDKAFAGLGLKEVIFAPQLKKIGMQAFANNSLREALIPDSVEEISAGAFATNPNLRRITIPHNDNYTVIEGGTFGCSDKNNWMTDLTSIEIPDTITEIKDNAFGGNNFKKIEIPASVKSIGKRAFSTKNYLKTPCELVLHEGLETIGTYAFRNKKIEKLVVPTTVSGIDATVFWKEDTNPETGHGTPNELVTRVYVQTEEQYNNKEDFQDSECQKIYLNDPNKWTSDEFEFAEINGRYVVTRLSEQGLEKLELNNNISIPSKDSAGRTIEGIGPYAFACGTDESSSQSGIAAAGLRINRIAIPECDDFVIMEGALSGNGIKVIDIPEGVTEIGKAAFASNAIAKVIFPSSIATISESAFEANEITAVEFDTGCNNAVSISSRAFADNKLKSLQIPDSTDVVAATAFADNPGMSSEEGVVYMYKATESGSDIANKSAGTSDCQDLKAGEIPAELAPWGSRHYTFSEDGTTITGFSEDGLTKVSVDPYIVLPGKSPGGATVTAVGIGAFRDHYGDIGTEYGYSASTKAPVKGITFAESITDIGVAAFQMCAIEDLLIPDSIKNIGGGAFGSNFGLRSITLSSSMTVIPDSAFVTNVNNAPFIDELTIPEGVTKIGNASFKGQHIKKLNLPSTLTEIGEEAFQNHQISKLEIPASVRKISARAFEMRQDADNMHPVPETLILHEGLEEIGEEAFGQTSLVSVEIPVSLKTISSRAFVDFLGNGRSDGEKVYLRTSSEEQAEAGGEYAEVSVNGKGHTVVADKMVGTAWNYDDFTYSDDGTTITGWSEKGEALRHENHDMVLPDKPSYESDTYISAIGDNAFKLNEYNETSGEGEVILGKYDATSPYGVQRVELPKELTSIGNNAFEYNNLQIIDLSSAGKLESIGTSAFHGNHLFRVEIPDTVTEMGEGAFSMNNIMELTLSKNVTKIPQGSFSMNIRMYEIEIPDTVTEIGPFAFAGARLEELVIPESVEKIGEKAFHLHHLSSLTIPGNVKRIEDSAFEGTFKETTLKKLTLEEGIEYIGKYAFKEALIEEATLPYSLKEMGVDPFYSNKGKDGSGVVILTSSNPSHKKFNEDSYHGYEKGKSKHYHTVEIIPWKVDDFTYSDDGSVITGLSKQGKTNLSICPHVYIPSKNGEIVITAIGAAAFKNEAVESVTIPETVTSIGAEAFAGTNISEVEIPESVTEMDETAFEGANSGGEITIVVKNHDLADELAQKGVIGIVKAKLDLADAVITLSSRSYTYNGKERNPEVTVVRKGRKLLAGQDYKLAYKNNIKAGSASAVVTGIGYFEGNRSASYTISPKKITPAVKLSATAYTYNAKVKTPKVTVADGKTTLAASNYKVTFAKGRKYVGTYSVKVTLTGNYSGSKSVSFKINPKGTSLRSVKPAKKRLTVNWTKQASQTTGYQIQYSLNSKFKKGNKTLNIGKYKTVKTVIKGLKSKKTYYVRIRTYKKAGGKTYYSGWSKAKKAKVK